MKERNEKKGRKFDCSPRTAGALFSLAEVVNLAVALFAGLCIILATGEMQGTPDWYIYLSYILAVVAFAVVSAVAFRWSDVAPKKVYAPCKGRYFLIAILLQFGLFSLSFLNSWFLSFLGDFGYTGGVILPSLEGGGFFWTFIVVALLPAFFEESFFRGVLLCPLKKTFTPFAVLVCGGVFALYHQTPAQTIYQFCCGCAYALLALRSGSVFPSMAAHALNNGLILILYYFGVESFPPLFYLFSALALIAAVVLLVLDPANGVKKEEAQKIFPFFYEKGNLSGWLGVALCALFWIENLLMGVFG